MKILPGSGKGNPDYTRLRDFGAFHNNLSQSQRDEKDTEAGKALVVPSPVQIIVATDEKIAQQAQNQKEQQKSKSVPQRNAASVIMMAIVVALQRYSVKIVKGKWLSLLVRITVTVILLLYVVNALSWSTLATSLVQLDLAKLLGAVMVGLCGVIISSYQWWGLLRTERIRSDLVELIKLYMVGIAFNQLLPTSIGGDAVKAFYVGRRSGNLAGATSAVILCRITGFFGMLLIAFPVLIIWHDHFSLDLALWFVILSLSFGVLMSAGIIAAVLLPGSFRSSWLQRRLPASLLHFGEALHMAPAQPQTLIAAILCGSAFWAVAILNCYSYGQALGITLPFYFYCVAVPLVALVSFLPISLNGIGVRESAFMTIFSIMAIAPETSLLLAILLDLQSLCFSLIGGGIYLRMRGKRRDDIQEGGHVWK